MLSFIEDSSKRISHVFSEKTGKLKNLVKKDYLKTLQEKQSEFDKLLQEDE